MNTFTDPRDNNSYKIVKINNLYWFAENLRYREVPHYFPNRDSDSIQKYGCLYTWETAKAACPKGWRLPTDGEFDNLAKSSFSGPLAGVYDFGNYYDFGNFGGWWSSTEYDSSCAYFMGLSRESDIIHKVRKESGLSVRYVKNVAT